MHNKTLLSLLIAVSYAVCGGSFAGTGNDLYAGAEARQPEFVKDLRTLVNIDSGTGDQRGLAKAEAYLAERLKSLGAQVEILEAPPSVGNTVVGTFQGHGTKNIMMMIHYDTVFDPGEAAKRPFRVKGGKAFGPGIADAKGGALIILHALDIAHKRNFKGYRTLTVLFNPDEERGSEGSRELIRRLASGQDAVLSYEPPEAERVTVATNGIAWIHLKVKGLASHAGSAPEKGRNAAVELSHQVLQLNNLGDPEKGSTVNWTVVQAGHKDHINIIPDQAAAIADMRLSDLAELDRVRRDANKIIENKLIPETEVNVTVESRRPPLSPNPASDNLAILADKIYRELGKTLEPVMMRYGTDAGFAYHPDSGKPAVLDGMGIVGGRIHTADEWADLTSVPARLYLTVRMLEVLAQQP
ncbi:MAG: glutamate carboxypeptidase [Gammaproteobacteria bacterium]